MPMSFLRLNLGGQKMLPLGLILFMLLPPLGATAQTVVQFKTALGAVDVELFDSEKPATVANFLRYVTNGLYKDMFLHRWEPGFVVQGGGFAVSRRGTTNSQFTAVSKQGNITNEYLVGPKRSNVFGTIAMAKIGNDPNSASSEWFFNLGDNSANLDSQNGGFTVFGQVIAGTNVLRRFNLTEPGNGIFRIDLSAVTPAFSALPVLSNQPTFDDLAYAEIVIISRPSAPSIVSQPKPQQVIAGEPVEFSVSATGTGTLRYQWSLNDVPIPGATNALLRIPSTASAQAGGYTVHVTNHLGGITSTAASLEVRFKLTLRAAGTGAITKEPDSLDYAPGASVTVRATAAAGWRFLRWEGGAPGSNPGLVLTLLAHQEITAVFERLPITPFPISWSVSKPGILKFSIQAETRAIFEFERSTDLKGWTFWRRMTNASETLGLEDSISEDPSNRFYRGRFLGFDD